MNIWRRKIFADRLQRSLVVGILLAGFLAAHVGIPLPVHPGKNGGQMFPCQYRHCGCATAEQCWGACCCFSQAEKLAWARANGVEPPALLISAESRCSPAVPSAAVTTAVEGGDCCTTHEPTGGKAQAGGPHKAGVATAADTATSDPSPVSVSEAESSPVQYRLTILSSQCRGLSFFWSVVSKALPCRYGSACTGTWEVVGSVPPHSLSLFSVVIKPPVPPPKV